MRKEKDRERRKEGKLSGASAYKGTDSIGSSLALISYLETHHNYSHTGRKGFSI